MTARSSADRAFESAEAQGLPKIIDDPVAYRDLAVLLRPTTAQSRSDASPSPSPARSRVGSAA